MEDEFMGVNLEDVQEPQVAPDKSEALLEVVSAETNAEKRYTRLMMRIIGVNGATPEVPLAKFSHFLFWPKPEDESEKRENKLRSNKRFYQAFNLPLDGSVRTSEFTGRTGYAILSVTNSEQYGAQNEISKLILPH